MVDRRNKLLRKLRRQDYQRFEWVMKQVNIAYKPVPRYHYRVTRKGGIRELTQKYCEDIRIARLQALRYYISYFGLISKEFITPNHCTFHDLRDAFKAQQENFLKEKEEKLHWITEEEKDLGLVSEAISRDIYNDSDIQPPPVASTLLQIARTSEGTQDCPILGPPPEYE